MQTARILIVEDHLGLRIGLAALIGGEPDLTVAGEAVDGAEAVRKYGELMPDLVLMDLHLPRVGGVEAIKRICEEYPDARIVAWTISKSDEALIEAYQAGACSHLEKTAGREDLLKTLRAVVHAPDLCEEPRT